MTYIEKTAVGSSILVRRVFSFAFMLVAGISMLVAYAFMSVFGQGGTNRGSLLVNHARADTAAGGGGRAGSGSGRSTNGGLVGSKGSGDPLAGGSGHGGGGGSGGGGAAGDGGGGCFTADTPVLMADGKTKPIADVRVGDVVTAFDELGNLVSRKVIKTYVHQNRQAFLLNGLKTTAGHLFLTASGEFKLVGNLKEGVDVLVNKEGVDISSWSLIPIDGTHTVYNFAVETSHTYIAGDFRVHNMSI